MTSSFLKKSFGDKKINSQPLTENTADSELMSDQATIDEDEASELFDFEQQDQEDLQEASADTEKTIYPVHTRSTRLPNPSPQASSDPQAATPSPSRAVSGFKKIGYGQTLTRTRPTAQTPATDQTDNITTVQNDQQDDSPLPSQAPLASPMPSPIQSQELSQEGQPQRTRTPREDGKVTLVAVIDPELHDRVKKEAKNHKVPLKRMVEMMIENCFPTS